MSFKLIFSVLALSAIVMARPEASKGGKPEGGPGGPKGPKGPHGGPHGGPHSGPGLPPFLANISSEGKKEFGAVFKNENLTLAEMDTQLAALAEKYEVSTIYKEFQANITAHLAEIKKNQTTVIGNLAAVSEKLAAIFANKDQTRDTQRAAVEAIHKESPVEVEALRFIGSRLEGPKAHGAGPHGGPHGKPNGGPRGGPKGGPKDTE